MRKVLIVVGIVVVLAVILIANVDLRQGVVLDQNNEDVKSISYSIKGEVFQLKDGKAENELISSGEETLNMFGEPVYGDLDGDGDEDAAVLLANTFPNGQTSYYAALAIKTDSGYKATESMALGHEIAPQTVEIREGRAVYNFAERKAGEPVSVQPSIGKSVWVHYDQKSNSIGEWVKDFEGESNLPPEPN